MKKMLVLLALVLALPVSGAAEECFMLLAGREATADGAVLLAHNEDNGPQYVVRMELLPRVVHPSDGAMRRLDNGALLPEPDTTWARWILRMPGRHFSHALINEKGVAVVSDNCPSREDSPRLVDGGLGPCLRLLVAERARSAREGARLVGELVSRYGYNQSGRTLGIADSLEGWMVAMVNGCHWVAARVPDDQVAVLANSYALHRVDLADTLNFMGSPDIVDYAISRGWYDPAQDGEFDFERVFAERGRPDSPDQTHRHWSAIERLAPGAAPQPEEKLPLPFAVRPANKLDPTALFAVLRDHYEGTSYAQDSPPHAEDYPGAGEPICNGGTNSGSVFQLRGAAVAPAEGAGSLWWLALGRPCSVPFVPLYPWALGAIPPELNYPDRGDSLIAPEELERPEYALNVALRWDRTLDANYQAKAGPCREQCGQFEARLFERQLQVERQAAADPAQARELLGRLSRESLAAWVKLTRGWLAE